MALKTLMLRLKIDGKSKELEAERKIAEELATRSAEFAAREAEIETAIAEVETQEQRDAVETSIAELETQTNEHNAEVQRNADKVAELEREVAELEAELSEAEKAQDVPAPVEPEEPTENKETRKGYNMYTRYREFSLEQRHAFVEDHKEFIDSVRSALSEQRAISNIGYTLPVDWLGLIRAEMPEFSLLYKHVNVKRVNGNGRGAVLGIPGEAVWTELCGKLNEMTLGVYQVQVSLHKLGLFVGICNAAIYMSDEDLTAEIIRAIAQAMAFAYDKAIVFGDGVTMPEGIAKSILDTTAPSTYPATARPWADLHTSNVKTIAAATTDKAFFKALVEAAGAAKAQYGRGGKFFIMNEATKTALMSNAIAFNANGAVVASVNDVMPVIGGAIEVAEFMPDNVIVGGYGSCYTLAEGKGFDLATSEHAHFIEDETIVKGTTYVDGRPVIREAFVVIGINGTTPSMSGISFAEDTANA